ncbi:hypothetical protein [Streptomyces lavendofoliae]|uniref:hypothetical protein n=1 Tax=Streptomyces lavendofoliae TaxID=67314 RepID=UPI00300F7A71
MSEQVSLAAMPFGGGIVIDRTRLGVQQISDGLAGLLQGGAWVAEEMPSGLAEEVRRGLAEGWLLVREAS